MRLLGSALAGVVVAIALFLLMSEMISGGSDVTRDSNIALNLDFIRLNLDEIENIRRRVPPPEPEKTNELRMPPRLVVVPQEREVEILPKIDAGAFRTNSLNYSIGRGLGRFTGDLNFGQFDGDGDLYPVLRVSPAYPSGARLRRLDGWVDLEYTVLPDGTVIDPVVIDSAVERGTTSRDTMRIAQDLFDEAALEAIVRWKFKPRIVDGRAVPVRVVQRMNFNLLN